MTPTTATTSAGEGPGAIAEVDPPTGSATPTPPDPAPSTATAADGAPAASGRTRGTRHHPLTAVRGDLSPGTSLGLAVAGIVALVGGWAVLAAATDSFLIPGPGDAWTAAMELKRDGRLWDDLSASLTRIGIGYGISIAIGVVVGVGMASFRSVESFLEPQIGLLRYIPASALTPLFLLWLGIDEAPKIALITVGTVFFNILMTADVARAVPQELVNAAYTMGAGRLRVLRRVILPHSAPGIIDVARINLAAAWLMLVVSELLAAQEGLAFRVVRAQRFRDVDTMYAVFIVFAVIGVISDLGLRQLRRIAFPWSEASR